jgi:uncharacterized protein YjbI with pentapeptide repeats
MSQCKLIQGEEFKNCELDRERFWDSVIRYCSFEDCNVHGVCWDLLVYGSRFSSIDFYGAAFMCGNYINCTFENCDFRWAGLTDAMFVECKFLSCNFGMSNLGTPTDISDAKFYDCDFSGSYSQRFTDQDMEEQS